MSRRHHKNKQKIEDQSSENLGFSDDPESLVRFSNPTSEEIDQIFFGKGSEELTNKLIEELVSQGWEREGLLKYQKEGFRYNRSRNSLVEDGFHTFGEF